MKAYGKSTHAKSVIEALDLPRPEAEVGELLVKIEAVGVGVHDAYFHAPDVTHPYVIGIEGSGTVEEAGRDIAVLILSLAFLGRI